MAQTQRRWIPEAIWRKLPLLFAVAYGAGFKLLYRTLGPGTESLATVVVLLAASQGGLLAGLGVAAACVALHTVVGSLQLGIPWSAWLQGGQLATAMGLLLVGAVVGRLRDLRVQLDAEIAARKDSEIQLRAAQEVAETANRAKGEFLARMSHEIRTPMHGVLGVTQVLLETPLSPDQRQYVDMIQGSGELLLAIINDILDFSKIEAGKMELEESEFELLPVLRESLELVAMTARQKGLEVALDVPAELPPWLVGDAVRLRQVLINLLGNATKFTERGSIVLRARTAAGTPGHVRLRLEVQDTGIGIEPAILGKAFEPFTQADASTTRVYGGTGLGLAISSQLVALMGGRLQCQSEPERGSTFFFEVELAVPEAAPLNNAPPSNLPPTETVAGRVLVAEDNRINQVITTRLLETLGVSVDVVADGAAAVLAVQRTHYDVVLLDCQMPVLDGYAAAAQIRAAEAPGRHLPMLALTASVLAEDHERARAAGVDAVLVKPLRADDLRQAVLRYLPRVRRISQAIQLPIPSTELPVLEVATLADLKRAGGLQTVHAVVAIFAEAAAQTRAELGAASRDREALALLAHRQRGTAACVGARRLAASLSQLETIARSATDGEIDAALTRVDRETEAALRVLARYRNADSAAFVASPVH